MRIFNQKVCLMLVLLLGTGFFTYGQELPEIIPPNPIAGQFQKYIGCPVSPATGLADISIPLYNLRAANMEIPFGLKYYSSGIKVDDNPGYLGYGWSLFPGLRITRTVMGHPDDYRKTNDIRIMPFNDMGNDYLINICDGLGLNDFVTDPIDGQYDIFTVHLPNKEATFIMQWIGGELKARTIPSTALKIEPVFRGSDWKNYYFKVTDENGAEYIFGKDFYDVCTSEYGQSSEWMLEEIKAPGTGNTITFNYHQSTPSYTRTSSHTIKVDDYINYTGDPGVYNAHEMIFGGSPSSTPSVPRYNVWALTSINFTEGNMQFQYTDNSFNRLNNINVYNSAGLQVKYISFSRLSGDKLLSEVAVNGEGKHVFGYDMQPVTYPNGQDFFGFYNGKNNMNLIPSITLDMHEVGAAGEAVHDQYFPGADRTPDSEKMQAQILKKVTYPTGGWTSLFYEPHKFISKGALSFGYGLRVLKTETYDPVSTKTIVKTYKYGISESGLGILSVPYLGHYDHGGGIYGGLSALDETAFVSEKNMLSDGYPVNGQEGAGIICRVGKFLQLRRRIVSSDNSFGSFHFNIPVWYPEVNVYSDEGKTTYNYSYNPSDYVDEPYTYSGTHNYNLAVLNNLVEGSPQLQSEHIRNSGGELLQEKLYAYTSYAPAGGNINGIIVRPKIDFYKCVGGYGEYIRYSDLYNSRFGQYHSLIYEGDNPFYIKNYVIYTHDIALQSLTQRDYSGGAYVESTTNYAYDPMYPYNRISEQRIGSDQKVTKARSYYAAYDPSLVSSGELTASQISLAAGLKSANRTTTLLKKSAVVDNVPKNHSLYNYQNLGNNLFEPTEVATQREGLPEETRIRYHSYDSKGNVTSVSKENGPKINYVYSYGGQYPIAKIENAEYSSVVSALGQSNIDFYQSLASPTESEINNFIHPLRAALPNAQVTTYTYRPLVGITSITDPRNQKTTYEYDTFQRLQVVRDHNGKILKKTDYHYKP